MGAVNAYRPADAEVRVLLVEDSAVVRGMVRNWLENVEGVRVVDSAANGQAALEVVGMVRPDIVILDIEMPVMDGLTALPGILRAVPNAKVLVASTLSQRNAEVSLKALSLGAADYIAKPSFARDGNAARAMFQEELVYKVRGLAGAVRRSVGAEPIVPSTNERWLPVPAPGTKFEFRKPSPVMPRVLTIGASTGGPAALSKVIEQAGEALGQLPVLIAQHMPPTFTALLGDKLAKLGGLSGGEAEQGEPVVAGRLYVAPGGMHMRVRKLGQDVVIALDEGPPINHCRPAVDPLFASVAETYGDGVLGVVLTGMGSDGAHGAVSIADAGGTVLAQDEETSVVLQEQPAPAGNYNYKSFAIVGTLSEVQEAMSKLYQLHPTDFHPPVGWVDVANCDEIAGWAWDPKAPDQPIDVEFYDLKTGEDPKLLKRLTAKQFRQDLAPALGDNGRHAYNIPTASILSDGHRHTIRVEAVNSVDGLPNRSLQPTTSTLECPNLAQ